MRRRLVLVITLTIAFSCCTFLVRSSSGFTQDDDIEIGLYYYVWYDEGYGNRHWNSTPLGENTSSLLWNVVDTPILGFYNSQNTTVIKQHLEWFKELGIDFLIISWWGMNSYEDNSTKTIFSIVEQDDYLIEIAIMVEAFNWSGVYNFKTIYDYIYNTYVTPYESIYMQLDDLPLVCFFNDRNMTGTEAQRDAIYSDGRFTSRIVGHNDYVDWWFGIPCSVDNSTVPPLSPKDGMICVEPRYDDQFLGREKNSTFDEDLTEDLYDKQWNKAITLANESKVKYVTIYSWNEYHERSQIEPHISMDGNYILSPFCKTKCYTQIIPEFSLFLILSMFMIATLLAVIVYRRKHTVQMQKISSSNLN